MHRHLLTEPFGEYSSSDYEWNLCGFIRQGTSQQTVLIAAPIYGGHLETSRISKKSHRKFESCRLAIDNGSSWILMKAIVD